MIPAEHTHAIVYTGAPYNYPEGGHIVSTHLSREGAERALAKLGELAAWEHYIVGLDDDGGPRWPPTPREFFSKP